MSEIAQETQEDFQPQSLDTIFEAADTADEAPAPEPEKAAPETPKDEETDAKTEDSPSESKEDDKPSREVPLTALLDERDRRKAEKERADKAEAELAALRGEGGQQSPSVFEDENAYREDILARTQNLVFQERMAISEELATERYGQDVVQAAIDKLAEIAPERPELAQRFRDARSPFAEAVKIVQEHEEYQKMQNIDEYKAELRKEILAELEAEKDANSRKESELDDIPQSLAGVSGDGAAKAGSTWDGPTPLETILSS